MAVRPVGPDSSDRVGRPAVDGGPGRLVLAVIMVSALLAAVAGGPADAPAEASVALRCNGYPCFDSYQDLAGWSPAGLDPRMIATRPRSPRPATSGPRQMSGLDIDGWAYAAEGDGATQGGPVSNLYGFNHWQYTDVFYVYVHGLVSVPPVVWTNAAHRNGVEVLGVVTADWGQPTSVGADAFEQLFAPEHKATTVAQLDLLAKSLHFDGWVIDVEGYTSSGTALSFTPDVIDVISQLRARGNTVAVYRAYVTKLVDKASDNYEAARAAGSWQSDYPTKPGDAKATHDALDGDDFGPFDAYQSTRVYDFTASRPPSGCAPDQLDNTKECLRIGPLLANLDDVAQPTPPSGGRAWTSIGIYAPAWPIYGGSRRFGDPLPPPSVWRPIDDRLWEGATPPSGPDCDTAGSGGVSQYLVPRSPVGLPFVSHFNRGMGDAYWVDGERSGHRGWNHLGVEDPLPTWLCAEPGNPAGATIGLDDGAAWEGATALEVSMPASGAGTRAEWGLWSADLDVPAFDLRFRYRSDGPAVYLRLLFSDGSTQVVSGPAPADDWTTVSASIVAPAGARLVRLSVGVDQAVATSGTTTRVSVGEVALGRPGDMVAPTLIDPGLPSSSVLRWSQPPEADIRSNIYAYSSADHCLQFLGPSLTSSYDVSRSLFPAPPSTGGYRVQPVSPAGTTAALDAPLCAPSTLPPTTGVSPLPPSASAPTAGLTPARAVAAGPRFTG